MLRKVFEKYKSLLDKNWTHSSGFSRELIENGLYSLFLFEIPNHFILKLPEHLGELLRLDSQVNNHFFFMESDTLGIFDYFLVQTMWLNSFGCGVEKEKLLKYNIAS